jgi:hypothetical protein
MKTNNPYQSFILPFLSLFTSLGTIMCCALPALLVSLGLGASLAGLVSAAPWITVLSDYKILVFAVSGLMIVGAGLLQWRGRHAPCPADPAQAKACMFARKASWWILGFAAVMYLVGFFFAFVAVYIFY